jgi:hypothetical protein
MTIATASYSPTSPYFKTGLIDNKFLDILNYQTIPAQADDIYQQITTTYQYRPDLLSFDLYGKVDYWYVFILRNRDLLRDPVWDFTADKQIYIPKLSTILTTLGR